MPLSCCRRRRDHDSSQDSAKNPPTRLGSPTDDSRDSTPLPPAALDVEAAVPVKASQSQRTESTTSAACWKISSEISCGSIEDGDFFATPGKSKSKKDFESGRFSSPANSFKLGQQGNEDTPETTGGGLQLDREEQPHEPSSALAAGGDVPNPDEVQGSCPEDASAILQELGTHCKQVRVFEAIRALGRFEKAQGSVDGDQQLGGGVSVAELRRLHQRVRESIDRTLGPGMRNDVKWSRVLVTEKKIGPNFKLELGLRFAEGDEVDPHGPASQLIVCGQMTGYPLNLSQYTALLVESDLLKREWIKDCQSLEATVGKEARLQGTLFSTHASPAVLPFTFEELICRGFCVCQEPPLDALTGNAPVCVPAEKQGGGDGGAECAASGGLLVIEASPPPGDATEYDGWKLPAPKKRVIRIAGLSKVLWVTQSPSDPNCTNILATARLAVPIMRWMLPMNILNSLAADIFRDSLRRIKEGCCDHWAELDYDTRIEEKPEFYRGVYDIQQRTLAAAAQTMAGREAQTK